MEGIAQVKLKEIQKQRTRILALYDEVSKKAEEEKDLEKKLKILSEGVLKNKLSLGENAYKVNSENIHHLQVFLKQCEYKNVSKSLVQSWVEKMEKEIQYGRFQTEFAYLFGSVLQEWASKDSPHSLSEDDDYEVTIFPKQREEFVEKVTKLFDPVPDKSLDLNFFRSLVTKLKEEAPQLSQFFSTIDQQIVSKVSLEEIKSASQALCLDNLVSLQTKKSLKTLQKDDVLANEYAGVVTILLKNYQEWNWPENMSLKLLNNRSSKWRVFVEEDVLNALFLQVVGVRFGSKLKSTMNSTFIRFKPYPQYDLQKCDYYRHQHVVALYSTALPSSFTDSSVGSYDSSPSPKGMSMKQKLLQLLATETKCARELNTPLVLVSADIENFYLSIPHQVLLVILEEFGCPDTWITFIKKFLTPNVTLKEENFEKTGRLSRGVPTGHSLSKFLHEILLLLGDYHSSFKSDVIFTRNFDDYYFWSQDAKVVEECWKNMTEFLGKAALNFNPKKSGHFVLNHKKDSKSKLPIGDVKYGFLVLDSNGNFVADNESVNKMKEIMEKRLSSTSSLLSWIRIYNTFLKYIFRSLGDSCNALGLVHVKSVSDVMASLHNNISGTGVITFLETELKKRFQRSSLDVQIPEAWYYWPITAGGLGVFNPFLTLSVLELMIQKDSQNKFQLTTVSSSFCSFMSEMRPSSPPKTTELLGRIEDFKKRGSNLRGKTQASLGVYWEWLLCNYSHQIVETVGTLEFTDPQLVPLALIQGITEEGTDE